MAKERRRHIVAALETGKPVVFEDERGGRHFVNHIMPVRDDDEVVVAAAIFALDTTERKLAEEKLRESEERYRQIISTCIEGVWQIDHNNVTSFVNPQMASILGYSVEEFIGRSMYDFMDDEGRALADANVERRRQGISERHEFRFKHKDGRDVWTTLAANPIHNPDGSYAGAVALVTDTTERRKLERRMLQSQKLESLGVLAGGIAHDFNNLLVGIMGNVGLAEENLEPTSPARYSLKEIEKAAEAAAALTKELLAYSGQGQFVIEPLVLNQMVSDVSSLLTAVISKNANLELRLGSGLPLVSGDATQLKQVVMNLITNASDALGEGPGKIRVSTSLVRLEPPQLASLHSGDDLTPGEYVCLEVADTGTGMDPDTQLKIFDPFFTTKFTGRGLGLAAVLGILRGHGAGLEIDSEPDRGSRFRVFLAAIESDASEAKPTDAVETSHWRGSGLVLVVDDEPTVRDVASRILESVGLEVIACSTGDEAIANFKERHSDIKAVLLDMTMPGLTGPEVLAELRSLNPAIPVVLTSGYIAEAAMRKVEGVEHVTFLQKPYRLDDFIEVIRRALSSAS
jgi:PAS domain S-box-containing protein